MRPEIEANERRGRTNGHNHDGSDDRGHPRGSGRQDALAQPAPFRGPGGDRLDRLYGPGQFRHQHPGWGEIRLCAAVGGGGGQCHRHALSGAVGQARHRHRAQPRRDVPRPLSQACGLGLVGRQRSGGDGDRPRRVPRRRDRPLAPSPYPAYRRHGRDRDPHVRHPHVRGPRVSADRAHHRRARRGDRPLLPGRDVHRPDRLGRGGDRQRGSATSRRRRGDDRGRHRRRDHHAACDLPPFRAHPEQGAGPQRPRAAPVAAVLERRGSRRAHRRRARQHGDGDDGGERLPRGPQRGR